MSRMYELSPFERLPAEVLIKIFSHYPNIGVYHVCTRFRPLVRLHNNRYEIAQYILQDRDLARKKMNMAHVQLNWLLSQWWFTFDVLKKILEAWVHETTMEILDEWFRLYVPNTFPRLQARSTLSKAVKWHVYRHRKHPGLRFAQGSKILHLHFAAYGSFSPNGCVAYRMIEEEEESAERARKIRASAVVEPEEDEQAETAPEVVAQAAENEEAGTSGGAGEEDEEGGVGIEAEIEVSPEEVLQGAEIEEAGPPAEGKNPAARGNEEVEESPEVEGEARSVKKEESCKVEEKEGSEERKDDVICTEELASTSDALKWQVKYFMQEVHHWSAIPSSFLQRDLTSSNANLMLFFVQHRWWDDWWVDKISKEQRAAASKSLMRAIGGHSMGAIAYFSGVDGLVNGSPISVHRFTYRDEWTQLPCSTHNSNHTPGIGVLPQRRHIHAALCFIHHHPNVYTQKYARLVRSLCDYQVEAKLEEKVSIEWQDVPEYLFTDLAYMQQQYWRSDYSIVRGLWTTIQRKMPVQVPAVASLE